MRPRRGNRRFHRHVMRAALVWIGMSVFVAAVYVVIVRGGGAVVGRTTSPNVVLSVLATATVALSFARVQASVERWASRLLGDRSAAPYDVLSRFSDSMPEDETTDHLPARMARLLAEGTGARWAQVWVSVSDRLALAATWPPDSDAHQTPPALLPGARDAAGPGLRALAVTHGGEPLGVLRLQERPGLLLAPIEERLFIALADRAGLMLRHVGVRADLEVRRGELGARADELKASRRRLIEAQDAERRRLERDLHDGAQQHLVALTVNLRLAQTLSSTAPVRAAALLGQQADAATVAIETLSSLSRGIYPSLLSEQGLVAALRSAVGTSAIPVTIAADGLGRLPATVEAALYFCCMEAVQNAAKHSEATTLEVRLSDEAGMSRLVVIDDGNGFDHRSGPSTGAGLTNMRDRLDAVGGVLSVTSLPGTGTTVTAHINGQAA
ncbi:MAG: ATP-binding protein [Jiangellaceae bacterium]